MSETKKHEKEGVSCPFCYSPNVIPIVYGYPADMDAYLEAWRKGVIIGGGCCVSNGMPTHYCKDCKEDFGSLNLKGGSGARACDGNSTNWFCRYCGASIDSSSRYCCYCGRLNSGPALEDAIQLAAESHRGQKDKAGQPYILHVLIVMFRLDSEEERITGVLHDIVEQTPVTLDRLKALGYSSRIVEAIDNLTWRKDQESYKEYIKRLKSNTLAAAVKRADLADHLAPPVDRGPTWLEKNHPDLYERYRWALSELGRWKVLGQNVFDEEAETCIVGEYISESEALYAAYKYLKELQENQPTSGSGGKHSGGTQDQVYVESPDGKLRRIIPPSVIK